MDYVITEPRRLLAMVALGATLATVACGSSDTPAGIANPDDPPVDGALICSIPRELIFATGVQRDGIPALTDPTLVPVGGSGTSYLRDGDRVIGIEVGGTYIAIPHNILWWHEIVNFNSLESPLAVTYCPLTGSSMVFDRMSVGGAEFGVSGLLFNNNLMMYERVSDSSLWPQMIRGARCGPQDGSPLTMYPATEMRWGGWRELHPETLVINDETGHSRDYRRYPYGGYEAPSNPTTLYPQGPLDGRRLPKERVLGIPSDERDGGGVAFPFDALDNGEPVRVVEHLAAGRPVVVFWDRDARAAAAFWPAVGGRTLVFEVRGDVIVDAETGSEWTLEGLAVSGEMEGTTLEAIPQAYVSFWFAWSTFIPDTEIWEG